MADAARYESHLSEQRFQLLVNAVTDYALYMLDAQGHVATWNPGARRFKGYEADEIIGRHFSTFFTDEDRAAGLPERALAAAAAEGKFEAEGWRVRKDGTRFWAHAIVDPIIDENGALIGFAKITRDITEKREAEEALRISEQRFRLLVQGVRDYAIYLLDREGHVSNWNAGAQAIKGYSADEIVGEHFSRFYTEEDRARGEPARALETALREGKYEREAWRLRKDGTRFFASVVIDPIYDDDGEHIGFAKITRDITERQGAGVALRESEQRFRLLVQGVKDYAIYMLDPTGNVSNWNSGAQAIKGYTAGEIVGQHFSRFYTEEDRAAGVPARALATALREGKYENEAIRVRKDGSQFVASVVIDPIYDERGEHIGFAKVTRDVTERRQAQQELEETRAALAQAQKLQALGELTGGIAHDFNNLMTVIRGSADLLRRPDISDEKRRRYLDAIAETADRAALLTSHLLAFGRRQALKPEVIDLTVRLDAFGEVLARTLGGSIEVKVDLGEDVWPIEVDSTQLETALLNAAFNARDAMPEGGTITLATANRRDPDGDWVAICLTDTGEGMAPDVLDRAFEPFFTTKAVGKGTGLGLSQIHGFIAQSGGRAEINSAPGKGTTIILLLPRSHAAARPAKPETSAMACERARNILLVEDNDHVRAFAANLLEELGHQVVAAENGDVALALIDSQPFDLLFSDVVMPGPSGVDLACRVRERQPDLPILLASGYSEEIVSGAGAAFEFVHKPYDAKQLADAIAAACERVATR